MQQAIYTHTQVAKRSGNPGHGTGCDAQAEENLHQVKRFANVRILMSVMGNVLGGTIVLSCMLMLPELIVSLLAK